MTISEMKELDIYLQKRDKVATTEDLPTMSVCYSILVLPNNSPSSSVNSRQILLDS